MVANVLNSDVFKSEGSKSSTNSLRLDLSSREKLLLTSFNSIAEFVSKPDEEKNMNE